MTLRKTIQWKRQFRLITFEKNGKPVPAYSKAKNEKSEPLTERELILIIGESFSSEEI